MSTAPETPVTFSFGKNWEAFVEKHFSKDRVDTSRKHILSFLNLDSLQSRSFLDIGCGSGLSSLAAFEAGASKVTSFDLDDASVSTTKKLREYKGSPENWTVRQGSILDPSVLTEIEPHDIVYSWGVLHHTGQMWQAIRNAATFVADGGVFYIALYTTTPQSDYWLKIKKQYNAASPSKKRLMENQYVFNHLIRPNLLTPWRALTHIKTYRQRRGMEFITDVRDWLGGYPYEDASVGEVIRFAISDLDMHLINITTGEACTEYLFKRKDG